MEIHLDKKFSDASWAKEAEQIVRKCVHCGFCNATCPTYQLLGHESDGPRGRIYLITQLLEGQPANRQTQEHLDRCLLCRACETTCPSGVKYGRLLEMGRDMLDSQSGTDLKRLKRKAIAGLIPNKQVMQLGVKLVSSFASLLPRQIASQLPSKGKNLSRPRTVHRRKMLLLDGCVQNSLTPETNACAARVLDRFGIMLIPESPGGCCGAVRLHTSERGKGLKDVRKRIDSWWPHIEAGAEAIVSSASGCGVTVKDYGYLLKNDREYARKARHISAICLDLSELIWSELDKSDAKPINAKSLTVAFQNPCSLQHGQKLDGKVEKILKHLGFDLLKIQDGHICCGSAGTYSMLQPVLSEQLKTNKLKHLQSGSPDVIVSANIGCQIHLRKDADVPLMHWIELLDNLS